MKKLDILAAILLLIGGLNWGIIGAFAFNIVGAIFGGVPVLLNIIYILIGLAALYRIFQSKAIQKRCRK